VFEYLAVGRPILAFGPKDGDVARVLGPSHLLVERSSEKIAMSTMREVFGRSSGPPASMEHSRPAGAQAVARVLAG
nr:hypothetical protein [Flavobacteriales bacterium]